MSTNDLLAVLALGALLVTLLILRFVRRERAANSFSVVLVALTAGVTATGFLQREPTREEARVARRPIEIQSEGYVTSSSCRACHAREYDTWKDSYHSSMTQLATPASVIADFDDVTLKRFGKTFLLQRVGEEFWVEMDDPMAAPGGPAPRVRRKVVMTTGSHNMQLCWYESGFSRVTGLLPFAYQIAEREWIPRLAAFVLPPSTEISPEFGQWSLVCLKCHATNGRARADWEGVALRGADTHVSEFGIACEACHGPAEAHAEANRNPLRRYAQHASEGGDPTVVNPARLDHVRSTQVCGQCHGNFDLKLTGEPLRQWSLHGFPYRPGDDLEETKPALHKGWDEQFWSDGVPRVAGREYNSLLDSACYERGELSCLSCHVLHQASDDPRPRAEWANDQLQPVSEDRSCFACHAEFEEDVSAHTHHPKDSPGSRCANCHMPYTSYGLLKGIRNHRIANPSVANTLETGRPNACNHCHLDRSLEWTSIALEKWYGTPRPQLTEFDRDYAAAVDAMLRGDAAQRALAAWSLGWEDARAASGTGWMAPFLGQLLDDPYEAVRIIAGRSLATLPGYEDLKFELLESQALRDRAKAEVFARWNEATRSASRSEDRAVLIRRDGSLDEQVFARLLLMRNNRVVQLFE